MRTGITFILVTFFLSFTSIPHCVAQEQNTQIGDTVDAPYTGLYITGGVKVMDFSGLDGALNKMGYNSTDNGFMQLGITFEGMDKVHASTRPTSQRLSIYYFGLPEEFDLGTGIHGSLEGWGFSTTSVLPVIYSPEVRLAITLGIGFEITELALEKEISFEDFIDNAIDNKTKATRFSGLLIPGLRFDYRFHLFGDPIILGLESGYAWDFASTGTWGSNIIGAPDDSNSGVYVLFGIGFQLKE